MLDPVAALREAIEVVRAQIPKGELTVASVQRLLETAERVCRSQEFGDSCSPSTAVCVRAVLQAAGGTAKVGADREGGGAGVARRLRPGRIEAFGLARLPGVARLDARPGLLGGLDETEQAEVARVDHAFARPAPRS